MSLHKTRGSNMPLAWKPGRNEAWQLRKHGYEDSTIPANAPARLTISIRAANGSRNAGQATYSRARPTAAITIGTSERRNQRKHSKMNGGVMPKRDATDEDVAAFMAAVFPDAPNLATTAFDEHHVLRTAAALIAQLREKAEALGDQVATLTRRREEMERHNEELQDVLTKQSAQVAMLAGLLRRIRGWDMLDAIADGPYWKREIDVALAAVRGER